MRDAGCGMRGEARHGISGVATTDGVDVVGWCRPELDPDAVSAHIRAELQRTRPDPDDAVDDFDYISIWCGSTGEVEGGMQLRTREPRRPLSQLVVAADTWLAEGGLASAAQLSD